MAVSLTLDPIAAPAPATASDAGTSPASLPDSPPPASPTGPLDTSLQLAHSRAPAPADPKRKSSRRANTAERRATHNAVERQRRETLNGRFLDLAALLPNLSQIRRPSKSAIVNSSIAYVHASRRHRLMAARELRLLKLESDALRRELNEWRDRAALPRCDEPPRSEGFATVLAGEIELDLAVAGQDDDEGGDYDGLPYDDAEDSHQMRAGQAPAPVHHGHMMPIGMDEIALEELQMRQREQMAQAAAAKSQGAYDPHQIRHVRQESLSIHVPQPSMPIDAAMYEQGLPRIGIPGTLLPYGHPAHHVTHAPTFAVAPVEAKSHVLATSPGSFYAATPPQAFTPQGAEAAYAMHQRQQQQQLQRPVYGSPAEGSDGSSSVSSSLDAGATMARMGRGRSVSNASGYTASSGDGNSFDLPHHGWDGGIDMMMKQQQQQQQAMVAPPMVAAGGGGSMHGAYAMMMM